MSGQKFREAGGPVRLPLGAVPGANAAVGRRGGLSVCRVVYKRGEAALLRGRGGVEAWWGRFGRWWVGWSLAGGCAWFVAAHLINTWGA
jgi:hypothetical protein